MVPSRPRPRKIPQKALDSPLDQLYSPSMFTSMAHPETFSGMKAHVFADNVEDAATIYDALASLISDRGLGCKVGTKDFFDYTKNDPQHGKGVTVYFPRVATYKDDLEAVTRTVTSLTFGKIQGDMMVSGNVGVRCEVREDAPAEDAAL